MIPAYGRMALISLLCKGYGSHYILAVIRTFIMHATINLAPKLALQPRTLCSFAVNGVMQYYNNRGSQVYSVTLDASKAFDRVECGRLFSRLMKEGLYPLLVRFLVNVNTDQVVRVK